MLPDGGIEQLHAEHEDHENSAKNLAGFALGEPAVDPCKDGADEQEVECGENEQGDGCKEEER